MTRRRDIFFRHHIDPFVATSLPPGAAVEKTPPKATLAVPRREIANELRKQGALDDAEMDGLLQQDYNKYFERLSEMERGQPFR